MKFVKIFFGIIFGILATILIFIVLFGADYVLQTVGLRVQRKVTQESYQYVESKKQLVMKLAQEYDDATTQITIYENNPEVVQGLKNQQKTLKDRMKLEASMIPEYELPERVRQIISH